MPESLEIKDTFVAIGRTDGCRYVGITPPLDDKEAEILGVEINQHNQIKGPGPETTLLLSNDADGLLGDSEKRNEYAFDTARRFAKVLRGIRPGKVTLLPDVVFMKGSNATPFNQDEKLYPRRKHKFEPLP